MRRQGGAIGLLGVIVLLLVVICTVIALDTGRLYMERQNLQRIADLAALETAEQLRHRVVVTEDARLLERAWLAAENNGHANRDDGTSLQARGGGLCSEDGQRVFVALAPGAEVQCSTDETAVREAVEVSAGLTTRASLFSTLLGDNQVELRANATARPRLTDEVVTFSVGSKLLTAEGEGLLGALLGEDLGIDALGYEGLASASLSLLDLIDVAAIAGTTEGALEDTVLNVADLAGVELEALVRGRDVSEHVLRAGVDAFQDSLDILLGLGLETITLGDILVVDPSRADDALNAQIGLGSLLESSIFLSDTQNFLAVDQLGLDLDGLANVQVVLDVIEPPQIAIGPVGCEDDDPPSCMGNWKTQAHTAQLRLGVGAEVDVPLIASLGVRVGVKATEARAGVEDLRPSLNGGDDYDVTVAARQQPLGVMLDLDVGLLDTPLGGISDNEGFISSSLGILNTGGLVGDLVGAVDSVLGGVLDLLGGLLNRATRINPNDNSRIEECVTRILSSIACPSWRDQGPAPALDGESDPDVGWGEEQLYAWLVDAEGQGNETDLGHGITRWSAASPDSATVAFHGDSDALTNALSNALNGININVSVLGVDQSLVGQIVGSLVGFLSDVLDAVLTDVIADRLLEPLLEVLGVNVSEVDVKILDIEPGRGSAELVL